MNQNRLQVSLIPQVLPFELLALFVAMLPLFFLYILEEFVTAKMFKFVFEKKQ